jgi:uncharacterized cupin superfamily protein
VLNPRYSLAGGQRYGLEMSELARVNIHRVVPEYDGSDPDGYNSGGIRLGPSIGAAKLGASIYELPPGQSICPYHYEYPDEEWLLVLEGRVTVRHPTGEDELGSGDVVCFPTGPEGAHKVTCSGADAARVMMLSTKMRPGVAVYPDSGKVGLWPGDDRDNLMMRRDQLDYWDGET